MRKPTRPREVGRGERVLPGLWRLRLPLPWPGVPHCNAWAIAAGDGIVLVDTGTHESGSIAPPRARARPGRPPDRARAARRHHPRPRRPLRPGAPDRGPRRAARCGRIPTTQHFSAYADDPDAAHARRVEIARQSGVPRDPPRSGRPLASGPLRPDRDLLPGVEVETDLGVWSVHETPGHAPSHVVLFQRERRLLISGDHLLGRVSLYFDYGYTPDPVGEFLTSLDTADALGARLALSGHGRPFADVAEHVEANRRLVAAAPRRRAGGARRTGPATAYDLAPRRLRRRVRPRGGGLAADQAARAS